MIRLLDRHWLLTTTTYGTWLPGDKRGFVSPVRADDGRLELHNIPGTPYDADIPDLQQQAREFLKCDPIRLTRVQAEAVLAQLLETARYRGWTFVAAGLALVLAGIALPPGPREWVAGAALAIGVVVPFAYSYLAWRRESAARGGEEAEARRA